MKNNIEMFDENAMQTFKNRIKIQKKKEKYYSIICSKHAY